MAASVWQASSTDLDYVKYTAQNRPPARILLCAPNTNSTQAEVAHLPLDMLPWDLVQWSQIQLKLSVQPTTASESTEKDTTLGEPVCQLCSPCANLNDTFKNTGDCYYISDLVFRKKLLWTVQVSVNIRYQVNILLKQHFMEICDFYGDLWF